jgi:hypothetical protein
MGNIKEFPNLAGTPLLAVLRTRYGCLMRVITALNVSKNYGSRSFSARPMVGVRHSYGASDWIQGGETLYYILPQNSILVTCYSQYRQGSGLLNGSLVTNSSANTTCSKADMIILAIEALPDIPF